MAVKGYRKFRFKVFLAHAGVEVPVPSLRVVNTWKSWFVHCMNSQDVRDVDSTSLQEFRKGLSTGSSRGKCDLARSTTENTDTTNTTDESEMHL